MKYNNDGIYCDCEGAMLESRLTVNHSTWRVEKLSFIYKSMYLFMTNYLNIIEEWNDLLSMMTYRI